MDDRRTSRLNHFFRKVLHGEEKILKRDHAKRFVEAIQVSSDAVACISSILSSDHGMAALRQAVHVDVSLPFVNDTTTSLLRWIQHPEIGAACGGDLIKSILQNLIQPPIFWHALCSHVETGRLSPTAIHCFAWMLLELLLTPEHDSAALASLALKPAIQERLCLSQSTETRNLNQRIIHVVANLDSGESMPGNGPGGRHDNDHQDFRKIAILPSVDELNCTEAPFLRLASEINAAEPQKRLIMQLDNQFRLLREDMLRDLKDEILGRSKQKRQKIEALKLLGLNADGEHDWDLTFECGKGLSFLPKDVEKRIDFLKKHPKILPEDSLTCIFADGALVGLGRIWRNVDDLGLSVPIIHVRLPEDDGAIRRIMDGVRKSQQIQLLNLSTALYSYEPVLKQLQRIKEVPIAEALARWEIQDPVLMATPGSVMRALVGSLERNPSADLQEILSLPASTRLDSCQFRSFMAGLTQTVALIQGPPGTGKSFIGALVAKAMYRFTTSRILVLSYTNHALDQYLEDLVNIGIDKDAIVRLGSSFKASPSTKPLVLREQLYHNSQFRRTRVDWDLITSRRTSATNAAQQLQSAFQDYSQDGAMKNDLMEFLEFSDRYQDYYEAFQVPDQGNYQTIGEGGRKVDRFYLLDRWCRGLDAGAFRDQLPNESHSVWKMSKEERNPVRIDWLRTILSERLAHLVDQGEHYNRRIQSLGSVLNEGGRRLIASKRIIGCTTTAAAKHVRELQSAAPDIVIVEEAGEILESHILTALGPSTKQMILIGDHKQLPPKAHYDLSVEKGTGYDLNRSLFERLVLKGYPHETLSEQHRMRPEISALVRTLTYPDLVDAAGTKCRKAMRGFSDSVVFVDHRLSETLSNEMFDPREGGRCVTKTNDHEAHMTLCCVRYLAQQGYRSDQVVVLTPYLGQLRHLMDVLQSENDPVLNDMDSHDLVRAGLMPPATAAVNRRKLRISTVDNYQGEESDIVVVSLTRSNPKGDIGFLSSPERLNVLLSRARDGLILIGNSETFLNARKGRETWTTLLNQLRDGRHIYDGFPVRCERHTSRTAILEKPRDFERSCPDGGCDAPCGSMLSCQIHTCPQRCHQVFDHSKMRCGAIITDTCLDGHKLSWKCSETRPIACPTCEKKKRETEKKQREAFDQKLKAEAAQREHEERIAGIEAQIEEQRQRLKDTKLQEDREAAIKQKQADLARAKLFAEQRTALVSSGIKEELLLPVLAGQSAHASRTQHGYEQAPAHPSATIENAVSKETAPTSGLPKKASTQPVWQIPDSPTASEWKRIKEIDGYANDAIDKLMEMTGLEVVKVQFLNVLQKIQISQRQGTDLRDERLGTALLGNPGTGKTTVARLYAQFLAEVNAIPCDKFVETTGSKLANEGASGAKKMLDSVLENGGGVIFIDEAYQLVSGSTFGGHGVLDFLLAEIENTAGKIVFLFAGYEKQMEKFFQHNPGIPSRLPIQLKFADYSEAELSHMLARKIKKKFNNKMVIEDGYDGLYVRVLIRRLHRQSGKEGFGNARALENVLAGITSRQSKRVAGQRREGLQVDDLWFSKEDLIGPEPDTALQNSQAWKRLKGMVGLETVKGTVRTLLDSLTENYHRELREKPPIQISLNRVFLGPPGTGKTTVAKLYGQVLADIGLLSTSECVLTTPSDFIGSVIGESEKNTKAILENTKGKVLVIDEAYMLSTSIGIGPSAPPDPFRAAVIDTIVSEVHSEPGEDRAVLLLGYREQMEEMLRKVNPGLRRRFPVENAFVFQDFQDDELLAILEHKLSQQGLDATDNAKTAAIAILAKRRRQPNFGNAGEVENVLSMAKSNFRNRQNTLLPAERADDIVFEPWDFDPDHGRTVNAIDSCRNLFKDTVNSDDVVGKLTKYIKAYQNAVATGIDPLDVVPFNFVFKGPSGTGKTTTARKIGKIFCDMGFLASENVLECSVTDLVGEYTGHTGPKVVTKFDEALGQVLFIDEAYRLGEGLFAKEAIDEVVNCLIKPKYKGKMLVVLAGYEAEIDQLLGVNPGLSSRFPEEINFAHLPPSACVQLLVKRLTSDGKLPVDLDMVHAGRNRAEEMFAQLSSLSGWGNGRDVETLASRIRMSALTADDGPRVTWDKALEQVQQMLVEKQRRVGDHPHRSDSHMALHRQAQAGADHRHPETSTRTDAAAVAESKTESDAPEQVVDGTPSSPAALDARDPGVSDAIWHQLTMDRERHASRLAEEQAAIDDTRQSHDELSAAALALAEQVQQFAKQAATDDEDEARRRHEEMRLQAARAKRAADEEAERLNRLQEEQMRQKLMEQKAQRKLRQMGVCPVGYRWVKQSRGYRCAGGSHFVRDEELA
ncbi:NFX1-type zinc finger-containing protein 1 [Sphaceloma murrayae]|uniref:NFX1-type zinc finger-containing protein 1 n=1 Tax=Sphaceloma murrayae TaxID=2082308 RepID=A0A2K1QNK7_9PEZI|nr:NFX1-type zinc finger-containing protein 1 [Sphaceloma murrayae]